MLHLGIRHCALRLSRRSPGLRCEGLIVTRPEASILHVGIVGRIDTAASV